jgi:hypothetical protein
MEGSAAPDPERLHRREARQTGGERGGAVGADAVRAAGEQREKGQRIQRKVQTRGSGCDYIITIIMRERGKEEAGAEKEGACPDHHLSAHTQQSRRQPGRTFRRESTLNTPTGRPRPADTLAPGGGYSGSWLPAHREEGELWEGEEGGEGQEGGRCADVWTEKGQMSRKRDGRMDGIESARTHAHTPTHTRARMHTDQGAKRADRRLGGRMARRCGWAHAREQARAWCGGGTRGGHVTRRVGT